MKKSTIVSSVMLFMTAVMLSGCFIRDDGDRDGHRGGYEERHHDEGHHDEGHHEGGHY
jgi:hypothetical protein